MKKYDIRLMEVFEPDGKRTAEEVSIDYRKAIREKGVIGKDSTTGKDVIVLIREVVTPEGYRTLMYKLKDSTEVK